MYNMSVSNRLYYKVKIKTVYNTDYFCRYVFVNRCNLHCKCLKFCFNWYYCKVFFEKKNNKIYPFRSTSSIKNNADIQKWHHLGIIMDADANITRVYINGSLYAEETLTIPSIDNLINANVMVNAFVSEDFQSGLFMLG